MEATNFLLFSQRIAAFVSVGFMEEANTVNQSTENEMDTVLPHSDGGNPVLEPEENSSLTPTQEKVILFLCFLCKRIVSIVWISNPALFDGLILSL